MTFWGNVKPKRWSRVLKPIDDMTRIMISRAINEGFFNYDYTWKTRSDIIGTFIDCLAKARVEHWAMIRLSCNIFDLVW